ncbi:hypothetical protein ACKC9G_11665 [Pokkaliibacter sp. CJK22405]|uniref:hypothetical protein n=1 Tax=Pokkaliibacter sp. CJK22405 TaxID=3384615 RepID=UPI003984786D
MSKVTPREFDALMNELWTRLGIKSFDKKSASYRLEFDDEDPIYLVSRDQGWVDMIAAAGTLSKDSKALSVMDLLVLQRQQAAGLQFVIGFEKDNEKLSVRTSFRLMDFKADDVVELIQKLRGFVVKVKEVAEKGPQATRPGNGMPGLNSFRGLQNL